MKILTKKISRSQFLETSALSIGCLALMGVTDLSTSQAPLVGVCTTLENGAMAKAAGCDFIEEGVGKLLRPQNSENNFLQNYNALINTHPISIRSYIYFLPGEMKAVGPDPTHNAILEYATTAFRRAKITGAKTIVFGSSKARSVPDGFDKEKARIQFITLCKKLASLAKQHDMVLAVEQLNREETNFINTMKEAADIIESVNHPNFKMVCDIYHALREDDPASEIIKYKNHIVHCHIAEKEKRTAPGVMGDDFTPYFKALKKINYTGGISIECKWNQIESELPKAIEVIKKQYIKA